MSNVTSLTEIKTKKILGDFQKQKIKFDLKKLRHALNEVLKIKGFDSSLGIPHFAAISLTQIPEIQIRLKALKLEVFIGLSLILQALRCPEMLILMKVNIQNSLRNSNIHILKRYLMS